MTTPEQRARIDIDDLLSLAGWLVQDRHEIDLSRALGVAVREFPLRNGFADYVLFINRQIVGVIEAKKVGTPLSGTESQAKSYSEGLPADLPAPFLPLPFIYQSTGVETLFTNRLDPDPRSRRVFAFHLPETLAEWLGDGYDTSRKRLRQLPKLATSRLWSAQKEAIENLEQSLAMNKPRALIQMATGSGKTYTAVNYIYRLIKHAKVRRVLFLVDRSNLARQTLKEFQQFSTPDDGRKFTELYNVQHLSSNALDDVSKVCITTIQRLYSILSGEPELDPEIEERSLLGEDDANAIDSPKTVYYNPAVPVEYFDVIVTDECHRSIYNLWRQVLEYFDAFIIGMTATPSKQTFGFFNQNLVMEYSRERAVLDGVNVDGQVYVIRTRITEKGEILDSGQYVPRRDRRTRQIRMEYLDDELVYTPQQLDREVVAESQIRTVIRTFRDKLFTEIFPGRTEVPKTLVFAKDDNHAEEIVRVIREEFGKGNDFCKKITYRVSGVKPEDLIREFRNDYYPRIAVTVDMIAAGTDIKPLEILLFMRLVKSPMLFEQMQGRGTRVIAPSDLRAVTPDATEKDRFVIIDAVGVVESPKSDIPILERQQSVSIDKLLEQVSFGKYDDDTFLTLAKRLSRLQQKLTPDDREQIEALTGGLMLNDIIHQLYDATEIDIQIEAAQQMSGRNAPLSGDIAAAERKLKRDAADLLKPDLRKLLSNIQHRNEITIDDLSLDMIEYAGYSEESAEQSLSIIRSFKEFIEANHNEITALQILYNQPFGQRLTWAHLRELADELKRINLSSERLWTAYAQVDKERVQMSEAKRLLTDLVALVRYTLQLDSELVPHAEQVKNRYTLWLDSQNASGKTFTDEQRWWLDEIAQHIGVNLTIEVSDFDSGEFFKRGGRMAALRVFGRGLVNLLEELNETLAA
jgi:type I restriction enzyme, R subunit